MRAMLIGAALACTLAVPAVAKDRTGYTAIAAGSFAEAEATLNAERAIYPDRPELMLNLAAVYARTGREREARALYGDVLARDAVSLELGNGVTASSHTLAQMGMARLTPALTASR